MGWPWSSRESIDTAQNAIARGRSDRGGAVTRERALRHSAVWACLRLRADLISQCPVDVYRKVGPVQVEVPTPQVLQSPGGSSCEIEEWMYSTEIDLDGSGNTFGIVKARDGLNLPAVIELVPLKDVTVTVRKGVVIYKFGSEEMDPANVWHEKQFTTSGVPVGLSPLAYAAASIGGYLSAQDFAQSWFSGSGMPAAILRNTARKLKPDEATKTKQIFKASVQNGDVFTTGSDWDYKMVAAEASQTSFLDERKFGLADVCRYLGVPADMIDASAGAGGGSITYANITQRNLQLLIMNLGGAITRREKKFSRRLVANPRFVKLNTDALLRMDLASRYAGYKVAIDSRFMAPSEVRALEDRAPFTPEQLAEFAQLFPKTAGDAGRTGVPA